MRLDVADLVGSPGRTRHVVRSLTRAEAGPSGDPWGPAEDTLVEPIEVDLVLESMLEGLFVQGTIELDLELTCARCLEPVVTHVEVPVAELLRDPRRVEHDDEVEEGYVLDADLAHVDLETLLRDHVVPAVPLRAVCADPTDCRDPWADADVGGSADASAEDLPDPRWAALADLRLGGDATN